MIRYLLKLSFIIESMFPGLFASRYVLDPLSENQEVFFLCRVHVRNTESLRQVGDHRLEPLGSRAYPNSGNLGNCYPDA